MRSPGLHRCLSATILLISAGSLHAVTTRSVSLSPGPTLRTMAPAAIADTMLQSLRLDVAVHPDDYVTFETGIAAEHFLETHLDAHRETDRTMIQRGVLGYWGGKTVAIVPTLTPLSAARKLPR